MATVHNCKLLDLLSCFELPFHDRVRVELPEMFEEAAGINSELAARLPLCALARSFENTYKSSIVMR